MKHVMNNLISKYHIFIIIYYYIITFIFNYVIYFYRPSTAQIKEADLPAEYLNSSLAQQQQVCNCIRKLKIRKIKNMYIKYNLFY